jgi:hypothetical protein
MLKEEKHCLLEENTVLVDSVRLGNEIANLFKKRTGSIGFLKHS